MSKNEGTKVCKHCKSEIPAGAKICPQCRKKQGGIGKWIVLAIVVIAVGGAATSGGSSESDTGGKQAASSGNASVSGSENAKSDENSSEKEEEKIEYISVTAQDLVDAMSKNAMKASETYKEKHLKIKGKLGNIDSDGKYICIDSDEIDFVNIQCYIQSDEQKDAVMEKSKGDEITVKGYCTDVGEVMGYSIDIDSVK